MLKNLDQYTQLDLIGNGGYGKVYLGEDRKTGENYAFKFVNLFPQYQSNEEFEAQVSKLKSVQNQFLKPIVGYVTKNQSNIQEEQLPAIVSTYEDFKTLDKELSSSQGSPTKDKTSIPEWINPANQIVFLFAVASTLNELHQCGIYHGDLKPSNIFLQELENSEFILPLIGDYGLSSICEPSASISQSAFRAPELSTEINNNLGNHSEEDETPLPNEKTDVYSFGMLAFYLYVNKFPRGKNAQPLLQGMRPEIPKSIPHGIRKLIQQCWSHEPSHRPTMKTVLKMIIESRIDQEYPEVSEFMNAIEPEVYFLTQVSLMHHDILKNRVLFNEKDAELTQKVADLTKENEELKKIIFEMNDKIKSIEEHQAHINENTVSQFTEKQSNLANKLTEIETIQENLRAEMGQLSTDTKEMNKTIVHFNEVIIPTFDEMKTNIGVLQNDMETQISAVSKDLSANPSEQSLNETVTKLIEEYNQRLNRIEMMQNLQSEEMQSCLAKVSRVSGANLLNVQKKLDMIEDLVGKITLHKDDLEANMFRFGIPLIDPKDANNFNLDPAEEEDQHNEEKNNQNDDDQEFVLTPFGDEDN